MSAADGADGTDGAERSAPRRGPGRKVVVLAGLVAAGALAGATRTPWIHAAAPSLTGSAQSVEVTGADAAPAVVALALVALAAAAATSLSSRWLRFVTGPILVLAGIGAAASSVAAALDPASAAASAVSSATSVVGGDVTATSTAWPWATLVPAALVALIGVLVLLVGGRWPRGSRYRSPAVRTAADPEQDPAAAWDALTRGEDPTEDDPAAYDPAADAPADDGRG
ncbi:Trp biosynthesis-associated membrane protein [Brachybacterium sp. DNPG3]